MYAWDQSFAVGIPQIDAQHKQLFGMVNELHQAMKSGQSKSVVGQTLERLVAYTMTHFKDEEALMRAKSYSELAQHKQIHDQFTARIKKCQEDHRAGSLAVNVVLLDTLQKWLTEHVKGIDAKYASVLKQ